MNLPPNDGSHQPPTWLVMGVIWFAILSGMVMIMIFAGGGWPSGQTNRPLLSQPIALVALGMFVASMVIRWGVLPKFTEPAKLMVPFILGLATVESCMILGMFVLPKDSVFTKQLLYSLSFLGVLTYCPLFLVKKPDPTDYTRPGAPR